MTKQNEMHRVILLLGWWVTQIKMHGDIQMRDIAIVAEDLALELLNPIYGLELMNMNKIGPNFPGIDLGDQKSGVAFQVTSSTKAGKIKQDLRTFARDYMRIYPQGIRFLILSPEEYKIKLLRKRKSLHGILPGFVPGEHIISCKDLVRGLEKLYEESPHRFRRIYRILERRVAGYMLP